MTKARILANLISDNAELADGQISVAEVVGAAPLASPTFTGTVTSTGNIALGDDDELVLGSNRMRLYYSASNNYTVLDSNGTSGFVFDGVNNLSVNIGGSLSGAFTANGVSLYSGGTEKLQVYGSGTIALDDIKVNDDVKIGFGQFHTDLELYHDSATSTNKLVGDLTQTGKLSTEELDLSAIAATIADTAVDIFVYDTRKDSDGGAWRKRTQHTSWYNEAASATRGSRKEFPAVAVIVAETTQVTIYDGDDPDMPMWMVFNAPDTDPATYAIVKSSGQSISSATALNGTIATSVSFNGLFYQNFVSDDCFRVNTTNTIQGGNIYSRNGGMSFSNTVGTDGLVNATVNDVAMTVLPNAPIDAATGLPVPTIAVATAGGVSVIKDDGTVVDIKATNASFYYSHQVSFTDDGKIILLYSYSGVADDTHVYYTEIPSSDKTFTAHSSAINANLDSNSYVTFLPQYSNQGSSLGGSEILATNQFYGGNAAGLVQYDPENDLTKSLAADITSSYNTGWMNGDIKLATLSDTDATNVTGSELVTNGTFDTDTSGWTAGSGTTLSLSSNELVIASDASTYGTASQSITLEANTTYTFTVYIAYSTQIYYTRYNLTGTGYSQTLLTDGSVTSLGWQSVTFTTPSSVPNDIVLNLSARNDVVNQRIDNISIRKAEEDRSVNGNGLQVFGTVTKSAVATGADLVAYSGFASGTYLRQPYNADFQFGTNPFSTMGWYKATSSSGSYRTLVYANTIRPSGGNIATGHEGWQILLNDADKLYYYIYGPNDDAIATHGSTTNDGNWHFFCAVTENNSSHKLYVDGELVASATNTVGNLNNSLRQVEIGAYGGTGNSDTGQSFPFSNGSLCNIRISATAPSPEQIKKIYEDEKVLFQENAQATLYGSSDAVTALAYDDSTELLHVGTSAGRSVFQGLRRVDNTTDAVGAAISASNGLVAED